jgi:carboxyl-terminal processing protease
MNKLILFCLLIFPGPARAQNPASPQPSSTQKLVAEIHQLIIKHALYKDSLNWEEITSELNALRFTQTDTSNHRLVFNLFKEKFRKAGDKHSFFMTASDAKSFTKGDRRAVKPKGNYLGSGIAVIRVPFCFNTDPEKDVEFANTIKREIKKIDTRYQVSGWIVDLRHNTGGNMWPMLAGLNALIQDGIVGYFISPSTKTEEPWLSHNGRVRFPAATVDDYKVKNPDTRIAVLIDSMTASSGEMTAISFIGLPNVMVLGQPSAGYTTANATYYLSDGTMFNLATAYVADRNKKAYHDRIIPGIILNTSDKKGRDEALNATRQRLVQNPLK